MLRHSHSEEESGYTDSYRHRRYDPATACEIVERAAALQEEEEAMTAADVEELGRRSGVDPRYIRQVMAEMENGSVAYPRYPMTPRERRFVTLYPLAYGALLFLQMSWLIKIHAPIAPITVMFVLPALLCLYLGGRLRKPRLGAMAGVVTAAATILAIFYGIRAFEGGGPGSVPGLWAVIFGMLAGGATLGALGAEARKHLPRWIVRRRKRRTSPAEFSL
jgi:hypothetical protein